MRKSSADSSKKLPRRGHIKGQPLRFICGHYWRGRPQPHESKPYERHGMHHSPEHAAWRNAKQRCTNPNTSNYNRYGGRGIKFLFTSFEQFFAEVGPRPAGVDAKGRALYSLDRKNNDGNYEPGNVRWATKDEQHANQTHHGPTRVAQQPPPRLTFPMQPSPQQKSQPSVGKCRSG